MVTLHKTAEVEFLDKCEEILKTVIVDLNYESSVTNFDYKSVLKSPKQSTDLADIILASYQKDVQRDKAESFSGWTPRKAPAKKVPAKKATAKKATAKKATAKK